MMVARRCSHQKALRVEDTHAFCQQIALEARSMNRIRQKQPTEKAERMTGIVRLGKLACKQSLADFASDCLYATNSAPRPDVMISLMISASREEVLTTW
ncbi:hypothetical protein [Paenibacillus sp. 22594]|uniref:hypothetical protein n=1 Tax=Paenibacillus sp. 22594 TaxID=3453947 RepID=UPI003F847397